MLRSSRLSNIPETATLAGFFGDVEENAFGNDDAQDSAFDNNTK